MNKRKKTTDLILAGIFTALICVGAWIKIPVPPVPITLQFLFLNTAILAQRGRGAIMSVAAYIFLGLAGVPVFTGGGGPHYVLTLSFGYIIGFLAAAVLSSTVFRRMGDVTRSLINIGVIYLCGMTYAVLLSNLYLGTVITIEKLMVSYFLLFVPGDLASAALSIALVRILVRLRVVRREPPARRRET